MRLLLLPLFFCLLALASPARAGSIMLALSETGGPYSEFASTLEEALAGSNWKILDKSPLEATPSNLRPDLIIAVGATALRQALARGGQTPIFATLLPRQTYENLLAEAGKNRPRTTAIWLDQPPERQAAFLRQLLPNQKRIGMLFSPETREQASSYQQAMNRAGLTLDSEESNTANTLLPVLNNLLPRVGAMLAIPDNTIYRRENIKAILVTTYRHQRPLIAFSPAFVNAGALAALYTTPAQIARQTADIVISKGLNLPSPMPPSMFAITINSSVVQAMGFDVPDEATIRRALLTEREGK